MSDIKQYLIKDETLNAMAEAIRTKTGKIKNLTPDEMIFEISEISVEHCSVNVSSDIQYITENTVDTFPRLETSIKNYDNSYTLSGSWKFNERLGASGWGYRDTNDYESLNFKSVQNNSTTEETFIGMRIAYAGNYYHVLQYRTIEGSNKVVYAWFDNYLNTGISPNSWGNDLSKTIVFENPITVSASFYRWFIENATQL